jgi:hypothetical protein
MKLTKAIFCSFTIVVLAALANGFLWAVCMALFSASEIVIGWVAFMATLASGVVAIPGACVFVLFFYRWLVYEKTGQSLFRSLLVLAVIIAFCTACLLLGLLRIDWPIPPLLIPLSAVLAGGGSVLLHRSRIILIDEPSKKINHA